MKASRSLLDNEQVIIVSDREGDIYESFEQAYKLEVDVVIRSQHNRVVEDDLKISECISVAKSSGFYQLEIPSSGKRKKTTANLEIRYTRVELNSRPHNLVPKNKKARKDLEIYVVDATDRNADLSWRLLTTMPIHSKSDAIEVLQIYSKRWNIELFFKALKTGCNIEDCRLGDSSKLIKYISLMNIIAWRILWSNFVSREAPEVSCENIFIESEWKTAWLMLNKSNIKKGKMSKNEIPEKPPNIREAVHWIAALGGFLRRKGDKEPGFITFWRGWSKLQNGLEIYELLL